MFHWSDAVSYQIAIEIYQIAVCVGITIEIDWSNIGTYWIAVGKHDRIVVLYRIVTGID